MKSFFSLVCLLCAFRNILGKGIHHQQIYRDELSYDDIIQINSSCYPKDSCREERNYNPPNIGSEYSCSCHPQCWQFGTCCIDSPYRNYAPPNHECRSVGDNSGNGYYMVHKCPWNMDENSIWKSLCEKEWNGEDDILMLSPVTSLETNTTYKNFYCFKCHETTNKLVSWNLLLQGRNENSEEGSRYGYSDYSGTYDKDTKTYSVIYDRANKSWMATAIGEPISIPVNVSFLFPGNTQIRANSCSLKVISDCPSTWTDRYVLDKCKAYTAMVYPPSSFLSYKNAHCAKCNYEILDDISCEKFGFGVVFEGAGGFSFKHLLNINEPGEDKVGEEGKCKEDELWDPYGKRCRKLKCAIPRYVVKNGRCAPP